MQADRYCSHAQEAKQGLPPPRPVWCSRQRRAVPRRAVGMLRWQTRTRSIRVALLHDCALRCTVQQLQSACAGASYVACSVACCTLLQPWQTPLRSVRCPQPACSRPRCHPTAALPMLPVAPATAPPHVFPPRHRQRHKSVQPLSCTPSTRELRHRITMLAAGGARPRMRAELLYQSREIGARKVCTARVVRDGTQIDRRGDGRALCTVRPAPNPKQDAAQWRSTNGASCAMRSGTRPRVAMQGAARLVASATAQRCWDGWALWQVCEGSSHARVLWAALHREAGPSCKTHTYMYVAEIGLTGMAACSRPCERRYPNLYASHTASFSAGSAVQRSAAQRSAGTPRTAQRRPLATEA